MSDLRVPDREPLAVFAAGVLAGALVVGLTWLGFSVVHSGHPDDRARPDASGARLLSGSSADQTAIARAQDCAGVYYAQKPPLQAADAALAQWEVHIGAMNKLVTGAISLQQATQFWNDTRVGAKANLQAFARAEKRYSKRSDHCPKSWMASADQDLRRCHAAVVARNHSLHLADVTLATWRHHVMSMDMLRSGKLSPQAAERMWLDSWMRGNRQVHAFTRSRAAAKHLSC